MASYVDDGFLMLNETTGWGNKVTVLKEDTVSPRHAEGLPSGLADLSVEVMTATA